MNNYREFGIKGVRVGSGGNQNCKCPKCEDQRKKKGEKPLSVNTAKGVWNCHHCGDSGSLEHGWKSDPIDKKPKEEEEVPVVVDRSRLTNLPDAAIDWFKIDRGISLSVIEQNGVQYEKGQKGGWICFNYFEGDEIVNIKYRNANKKFRQLKGGKKIFYNLNCAAEFIKLQKKLKEKEDVGKEQDGMIITEGELDSMSFNEIGLKYAMSVPEGAPSENTKNYDTYFKFIENCADVLEKIDKFYLAGDADKVGKILREELARRVGKHKCWIITYPDGYKDPNQVLVELGADALRECYDNAKPYPIEDIILVKDIADDIDSLYRNGHDTGVKVGFDHSISDKIKSFDELIQFKTSMLTVITGIPSHGKALDINTPIPTPNGFKSLGELNIGDKVFDENGNSCNVVRKSEVWKDRPTYKIIFSDNSEIIADENHEWLTDNWKSRRSEGNHIRNGSPDGKHFNSQTYKRTFSKIRTTKEISQAVKTKNDRRNNYSINLCKPVLCNEKDLPINPYVLGCWLGDGTSTSGGITSADIELIDGIKDRGYSVSKRSQKYGYGILGLQVQLRGLGLLSNKHIPSDYLFASIEQRFELLRGLMDTDGHCSIVEARNEYCGINHELVSGVYKLICSLGIKATFVEGDAKLYGRIVSKKYRVFFKTDKKVFGLKRKQDVIKKYLEEGRGFRGNDKRYIISCELREGCLTQCIEVDSESHLFLAGWQFIPTHNSSLAEQLAMLLNVRQNWKIALDSPEHYPLSILFQRLAKIYIGKQFFDNSRSRMNRDELEHAKKVIGDNWFFIMPKSDSPDLDTVLNAAAGLILRQGVRLIIIDPWNNIAHDTSGFKSTNDYIEHALNKINSFKRKYDVHVFILAHPTKMRKDDLGKHYVPSLYDISDSAHWYNKCDNGVTVYRDFKNNEIQVHVQKVKYEHLGNIGLALFKYNGLNSRFYPKGSDPYDLMYGSEADGRRNDEKIKPQIALPYKDDEDFLEEIEEDDLPF